MTPSFGSYIGGSLALIGIVAAVGLGGYWLRRWIVPEFSGALAGSPTRRSRSPCWSSRSSCSARSASCASAGSSSSASPSGCCAALLGWCMAPREGQRNAAPQVQTIALLIALGVASFTVAEWTFPSQLSLDPGMFGGDTTWYHMPFAARIAQEHSTVHLHFTDPLRLAAWFYPQSSELIHAAAIVLFKTDWLSPLINLAWLAIALLAAWCVGRPYKVGPATLVAGGDRPRRRGDDRDPAGRGAQRHHGPRLPDRLRRLPDQRPPAPGARAGAVQDAPERDAPLLDKGPLVLAGIAAGLAASVKLTFLVPVAAIAVGVVLFSGRGRRLTTAWVIGLSMLRGRRLLVRAGGDQDRRQPDPPDRLRAAAPAAARPDAARPAAALRRRPLPVRTDDLPQAGSSRSSTTRSARSGR